VTQYPQVGGDVEGSARLPVHPTQTAGGEDRDARPVGQGRGGSDGGRAVDTQSERDAQIAEGQFGDLVASAQSVQIGRRQSDPHRAVQDGDGGRHRPPFSDRRLDLVRDPAVFRPGQPVGQDGRFECDDGPTVPDGVGHPLGNHDRSGHVRPPRSDG